MSTVNFSPRDAAGIILVVDDGKMDAGILSRVVGALGGIGYAPITTGCIHKVQPLPRHERHQGERERLRRLKRLAEEVRL